MELYEPLKMRRIDDRSLEVVRFVTRQIRELDPGLEWPELQRRWNRAVRKVRKKWQYNDRNGLWQAYKRNYKRLRRPKYDLSKWKRRDTTLI